MNTGRSLLAGLVCAVLAQVAAAQTVDQAQIDEGIAVYKPPIGNCEPCHGFAGGGALAMDVYTDKGTAPGPPLTTSKMSREQMIEIIACGRLGNETLPMPQYLVAAWTREHPCGGKIAADLPMGEKPPLTSRPLSVREIEAVVAFIHLVYQGKSMTFETCQMYWGTRSLACGIFK